MQEQLKTVATNDNIDDLINTINEKDLKINVLEDRSKELESKYSLLERKIDDNESYTRRQNLRIIGIPEEAHESGASCLIKVKEEISKLDLPLNLDVAIDRAHRIGEKVRDDKGNFISRPTIIRFTPWRARTIVYKPRPKYETRPEVGVISAKQTKFYVDLIRRRFQLKMKAIEKVKGNKKRKFVYADEKRVFNSDHELDVLLSKIRCIL